MWASYSQPKPTTRALSAEDRENIDSLNKLLDAHGTIHQQKELKPVRKVKSTGEIAIVRVAGKTKYEKLVQTGHVVCNPGGGDSYLSKEEFEMQTLGRKEIDILESNDYVRQGCHYNVFFKTVSAVEITPAIKQKYFIRADGTEWQLPPAGDVWRDADSYSVQVGEILVRAEKYGCTKLSHEKQRIHTINPAAFNKLYRKEPEVDVSSQWEKDSLASKQTEASHTSVDQDLRSRLQREAHCIELNYWAEQKGQTFQAEGWKAVRDAIPDETVHVKLGSVHTMKRKCKENEKVVMGQNGVEIVWSAEAFEKRNKRTQFRRLQHPAFLARDMNAEQGWQEFWSTRVVQAIQLRTDEDVKKCGDIYGYGLYAGQITKVRKDMWIVIPEEKDEVRVVLDDEFKDRYKLGKPSNSNFLSCFKGLICW